MPDEKEPEVPPLQTPTDGVAAIDEAVDQSLPPSPAAKPHDPYLALRSPNFIRFAVGFVCSSFGLQMLTTAVLFEVFERTHDALYLGYTGLARALPVVLLALVSGHVVDTHDRKKIVVLTQFGFAGVGVGLAVCSLFNAPIWTFYALLFASGCVRSFNGPSRQALLPLLVPIGGFESAVKWMTGLFQFSAVTGPLAAGFVIYATGRVWPVYAALAVLCVVFAIAATGLRPREHAATNKGLSIASLLAGFGHLRREKTVLGALLLDLFAVLIGGSTTLIPQYVESVLHIDKDGRPMAQAVLRTSLYVGALIMAVILTHRPPFKRAGATLLTCVAFFGFCTVLFGYSTSFWLSIVLLLMAGAADQVSVVIRHVLVQMRTPDHLRGRVGAVNSLFIDCSNELGGFESGAVAKMFGPMVSIVAGGFGTIAVVAMIAWLIPDLRRLGSLHEPESKG